MSREALLVTFMNGPADGRQVASFASSLSIGRASTNDVVIDFDPRVAERHLDIVYHDGHWELVDRSEGVGVVVNGRSLQGRGPLVSGSLLVLADTQLKIEGGDSQ